ncbi:YhbY family RNA-binding protein [Caballeronia glebae]|uniref:CRS1/YhbY domain-contain protein n=1 Tax=Caballeronia glebae TaxID=1777143 RepID=A0A157ZVL3_9BURK|nr:YhbY family RNA-binding protein [Caballeronia glebae]SAK48937.1 CRS1/YhbY domain-contain protein [Caballeronia glebae]
MPALKLSPAERSELRSQAHALKPVVLVGAEGLTDAVLKEINVHLEAHQLIKVRVFGDEREARVEIYDEICDRLNAAPIQHIGKLLVIWRPEGAAPKSRATRSTRTRSTMPPSAGEVAEDRSSKGRAPRVVKAVKITRDGPAFKKPKKQTLKVLGNERVTAGGNVKRAKKRQAGSKRQHQATK